MTVRARAFPPSDVAAWTLPSVEVVVPYTYADANQAANSGICGGDLLVRDHEDRHHLHEQQLRHQRGMPVVVPLTRARQGLCVVLPTVSFLFGMVLPTALAVAAMHVYQRRRLRREHAEGGPSEAQPPTLFDAVPPVFGRSSPSAFIDRHVAVLGSHLFRLGRTEKDKGELFLSWRVGVGRLTRVITVAMPA